MFATLRNRILTWGHGNFQESRPRHQSYLLRAFFKIIEDVLLWKNTCLSLIFIVIWNVLFLICLHHDVQFLQLFSILSILVISLDAFEMWLKYKHRTRCLEKLTANVTDGDKLYQAGILMNKWIKQKWSDFIALREENHTKAFLCMNIAFGSIFVMGKYIGGYTSVYLLSLVMTWFRLVAPPLIKLVKKFQQSTVCDEGDIDSLIPEVSEQDMKELSFEFEHAIDERQSLDYWKPEESVEDASDSSDNSTSIVTNLSMEQTRTLENDMESSSDSSEDDYIPKEQVQSALEVPHPEDTWSSSAVNALWNLTGAITNLVQTVPTTEKRKRISSVDSSDGFEIIDKHDVM